MAALTIQRRSKGRFMNQSVKSQCSNPNCKCDPCMCDPCMCGVTPVSVPYKGRTLVITNNADGTASVDIDGRIFTCTRHHGGSHGVVSGGHGHEHTDDATPVGMPMWMCDEAYFGAFDLIDVARHFADYGYMFDDPNRIVCDAHGNVVSHPAKRTSPKASKKSTAKKTTKKKSTSKKSAR